MKFAKDSAEVLKTNEETTVIPNVVSSCMPHVVCIEIAIDVRVRARLQGAYVNTPSRFSA